MNNLKARNPKIEGRKKAETRIPKSPARSWLKDPKDLWRYGVAVPVPEGAALEVRMVTASDFGLRPSFGLRASAFGLQPFPSHG
jgi:hypothetical protein